MIHYLKSKDEKLKFKADIGCKHPKREKNITPQISIGCNGECDDCEYGNVSLEMKISDFVELIHRADCTYVE